MSLAIQINLNKAEALNGTSELPAPSSEGAVTKTVDAEGVVVLEVNASTSFGVFDPGSLLGSKSADFVLQSLQVSSAGAPGGGPDTVALLGPAAPGGTAPRFVFHTLSSANSLFQGGQIIPVGYKISIQDTSAAKHVVRLTLWPVTRLEQLAMLI